MEQSMADCKGECSRVITRILAYTIDERDVKWQSHPQGICAQLSTQEIADAVAEWVSFFRVTVQEPSCDSGCTCVSDGKPSKPRELTPRAVTLFVKLTKELGIQRKRYCVYTIPFTAEIQETIIPIGSCRPVNPPIPENVPTPEPVPPPPAFVPSPKAKTVTVGGIAPVDADSKTKKKKKPGR
jgi:hypothetical protein